MAVASRIFSFWRRLLGAVTLLCVTGCSGEQNAGPVRVDVIGEPVQLADPFRSATGSSAGDVALAATAQGLLGYDARGEVVDALAGSWIVEDRGQTYFFRLKRATWPDGEPVRADDVAQLLRERMRANARSLAGLKPEVRAMTDRVIEIRLDAALPSFVQLLAQPQFAVRKGPGGSGPYRSTPIRDGIRLSPVPTVQSAETDGEAETPAIELRELRAARAALTIVRYKAGHSDLVLGGRFQHLPLVRAAGVSLDSLRLDPVPGLFGLAVVGSSPFLDEVAVRDALSRSIDRQRFASRLGLTGWRIAHYPLPRPFELARQPSAPAWTGQPLGERIESARGVIERWRAAKGPPPMLRIALPDGPGASALLRQLAQDFGRIGVRVDRVAMDAPADLQLIDEVAPFDSALWYLARLDCPARVRCDRAASALLGEARTAQDETDQARLLGEAEEAMVAFSGFLPLGEPIRWSLAGRRLTAFQPSPRGVHPLNRLIAPPN